MSTELKVVMFTDQVSSTLNMTRRTPTEVGRIAREQEQLTAQVVELCRGTMLKDTGDGNFIAFQSCADAVRCGFLLQQRIGARNESEPDERLRFGLHVGIDFGEALVLPNGDLRANTANLAARVCSVCPEGEVYFTEKVMRELHPREASVQPVEVAEGSLKGIHSAVNLYRLIEWLGPAEPTANPFIWCGGIRNPEGFFDRETAQRTLRAHLRGGQNCQVVGPRRIGKTSLLLRVAHRASEWDQSAAVAYVPLHDPRCYTRAGWLAFVGRQFGWPSAPADLVEFAERAEQMLNGGRRPVLCLDEFEQLPRRSAQFTEDFFLTLRSCGEMGMSIVTSSQRPLYELTEAADPTSPYYNSSPYYNTFPLLRLGLFAQADAEDFVSLRRAGVPPFDAEEKEAILAFAKGHPLALGVACFNVLEARQDGRSLLAAIQKSADDMRAHLPQGW